MVKKQIVIPAFSIDNYKPCRGWSKEDWFFALKRRREIIELIRLLKPELGESVVFEAASALRGLVEGLVVDPLGAKNRPLSAQEDNVDSLEEVCCSPEEKEGPAVWDRTVLEEFLAREALSDLDDSDKWEDDFRFWVFQHEEESIDSEMLIEQMPLRRLMSRSSAETNRVFVGVDLFCSDEKIIKEFKSWLKSVRVESDWIKYGAGCLDNFLSSLIEYQVIPFVDVCLYCAVFGLKISNVNLEGLLFSGSTDSSGRERIRTTKRYANSFFSETWCREFERRLLGLK